MPEERYELLYRIQVENQAKLDRVEKTLSRLEKTTSRTSKRTRETGRRIKDTGTAAGRASRLVDQYGNELKQAGRESGRATREVEDLTKALKRQEQQIKSLQAQQRRGGVGRPSGVGAGLAGGLTGAAGSQAFVRGVVGGFVGFAALGGANQLGQAIKAIGVEAVQTAARNEQLSISLDVLAKRQGVARANLATTERLLRSYGSTTQQARDSIQLFTKAGATQAEIIKLNQVAFDAAARRGLTLADATRRLADATAKAEPELLDELGIVIKLGEVYSNYAKQLGITNANTLTVEQRSRALVEALAANADKGGEFAATIGTLSRNTLDLTQNWAILKEELGETFKEPANDAVAFLAALTASINESSKFTTAINQAQASVGNFSTTARAVVLPFLPHPDLLREAVRQQISPFLAAPGVPPLTGGRAPVPPGIFPPPETPAQRKARLAAVEAQRRAVLRENLAFFGAQPGGLGRPALPTGGAPSIAAGGAGTGLFGFGASRAAGGSLEAFRKEEERRRQGESRRLEQNLRLQERILELSAGPGGEIEAAQKIRDLRIETAMRLGELAKDRLDAEQVQAEQIDRARQDFQIRILEAQRRQIENVRSTAGSVFDAITARGGGGLRDFFSAQLRVLGRSVFVNFAEEISRGGRSLGLGSVIGGQTRGGKLTGLGRVLRGTPFGVDQTKFATDLNTAATAANTAATNALTATMGGRAAGGATNVAAGVAGLAGSIGGISSGGSSTTVSFPHVGGGKKGFGRFIGRAGIVGGAAAGVVSGIRQGGAAGATTAIGAGLGAASLIPGPQQPFVAAGALIAGFVSVLFGNERKDRAEQIQREIANRRVPDPADIERLQTPFGQDVALDFRGRPRVSGGTTINMRVDALDAQSFLDRSAEVGKAVVRELQLGNGDLALNMQGAVFGA